MCGKDSVNIFAHKFLNKLSQADSVDIFKHQIMLRLDYLSERRQIYQSKIDYKDILKKGFENPRMNEDL